MNQTKFKELVDSVKRNWVHNRGIVVELRASPFSPNPLMLLTSGSEYNGRFAASYCKLWHKENMEYGGLLMTMGLRKKLSDRNICHASFRTSNSTIDSRDWKRERMCLGDPATCKKKRCPFKNAQPDTVPCVGETVSEAGNS